MEDKIRQGYLFDFYGELLNEHQRNVYFDYVCNDLSLSEIATEKGISRQGVHDLIRRCNKSLEDYESKLHLVDKFLNIKEDVERINSLAKDEIDKCNDNQEVFATICSISNDILEEL